MNIVTSILTILGLGLFETVSSIDNAVINAEILANVRPKSRKWFLLWGFLFAVVVVRGVLPWLIVWVAAPDLGPIKAFTASFNGSPQVKDAIASAQPLLLLSGGIFLVFLFFHWLFLEPKKYGLPGEKFIQKQGVWFYAVISVLLCFIVWRALHINPHMAFAAVIGSTIFFITHGFKQNAEAAEENLKTGKQGDIARILYLEVIDATFSIDGVLAAFAFTLSVPLIWIGNSLGAFLVRQLTIKNIGAIQKYRYLKNGAMYSVLFLGAIMLMDAFGVHIPEWISPIITFIVVGYFYLKSKWHLEKK